MGDVLLRKSNNSLSCCIYTTLRKVIKFSQSKEILCTFKCEKIYSLLIDRDIATKTISTIYLCSNISFKVRILNWISLKESTSMG